MKLQLCATPALVLLCLPAMVLADTIFVDLNNTTGPWDGSAANPYQYIQDGIDAAVSGVDTVFVLDGTYTGPRNKDLDFGGKAIQVWSDGGPDACIIDCEGSGRGFYFHSGEGGKSILVGFTIKNGSASRGGGIYCSGSSPWIGNLKIIDSSAADYGGGIYCTAGSSPTISRVVITGNSAADNGGGICCTASSPAINDCTIADNSATDLGGGLIFLGGSNPGVTGCTITRNSSGQMGGGFYWFDSSPTLTDCTVADNVADSGGGGGIFSYQSNAAITNCRITGNAASSSGGGINFFHDGATITNCTVSANSGWNGGGIYCSDSSPPITNCTITDNTSSGDGGGIWCGSTSSPQITNCIVWGNDPDEIYVYSGGTPTVTYCDIQGGWPGTGNINDDPLLLPLAGGTLRLGHGSPCIDAGTSAPPAPATDMEGRPRWDDPNTPNTGGGTPDYYDMGAHEFKGWYVNGDPAIGSDTYNGAYPTWQGGLNGPERTIQAGIDDAADGDVVTVAPWTYTGAGNRDLDYAGRGITVVGEDGATTTIIDCQGSGRGIRFATGETANAVVMGFTIRNGNTTQGGGIYCEATGPTILNCRIEDNSVSGYGGGIYCWGGSTATIAHCVITGNSTVHHGGGGIGCWASDPTITNCLITDNLSGDDGGGIACMTESSPTITSCTVVDNTAKDIGGGISCWGSPTITDCIVGFDDPDAIYVLFGNPLVTYCDVENGTGEPWFGTGCIDVNPRLVLGPLHAYYLSQTAAGQVSDSPCLNTGSDTALNLGLNTLTTRTDGACDASTVDMGYHAPPAIFGDVDGNGIVDGLDLTAVLTAWKTIPGDPLWNPYADLDGNGGVDGLDLTEVISNWGNVLTGCPAAASLASESSTAETPGRSPSNVRRGKGNVRGD